MPALDLVPLLAFDRVQLTPLETSQDGEKPADAINCDFAVGGVGGKGELLKPDEGGLDGVLAA